MAHSFFIIGLGFLLTLEADTVQQKGFLFTSLMAELEAVLHYVITGIQVLVCFLMICVIFQRWPSSQK